MTDVPKHDASKLKTDWNDGRQGNRFFQHEERDNGLHLHSSSHNKTIVVKPAVRLAREGRADPETHIRLMAFVLHCITRSSKSEQKTWEKLLQEGFEFPAELKGALGQLEEIVQKWIDDGRESVRIRLMNDVKTALRCFSTQEVMDVVNGVLVENVQEV